MDGAWRASRVSSRWLVVSLLQHGWQLNHSFWLCTRSWPAAKAQWTARKGSKEVLCYPNKCPNRRDRAMGTLSSSSSLQTFSTSDKKNLSLTQELSGESALLGKHNPSCNPSLPVCCPASTGLHPTPLLPNSLVYTWAGFQGALTQF